MFAIRPKPQLSCSKRESYSVDLLRCGIGQSPDRPEQPLALAGTDPSYIQRRRRRREIAGTAPALVTKAQLLHGVKVF
jgi:hypothetical protein